MIDEDIQTIFNYWNESMNDILPILDLNNLAVSRFNFRKGNMSYFSIKEVLYEFCQLDGNVNDLLNSIFLYKKVLQSDAHDFKIRYNLGQFIYYGLYGKTGYKLFLQEAKPLSMFIKIPESFVDSSILLERCK